MNPHHRGGFVVILMASSVGIMGLLTSCDRRPSGEPAAPVATQPAAQQKEVARVVQAPATPASQPSDQEERAAHEQSALAATAAVKASLAAEQYKQAFDQAGEAVKDYADTPSAGELRALQMAAEKALDAQRLALEAASAQERARSEEQRRSELQVRQEKSVKHRQEGIALMEKKDYAGAISAFESALREEEDAEVRRLLGTAIERATKPRLAVAEFAVTGDVGVPDVGKSVAELLLTKFNPDRFQLVERAALTAILKERDLTLAEIVENPAVLRVKRLEGVRYLIVGTVTKMGIFAISARLVDVVTGLVVQTAEIESETVTGLQGGLGELAFILQMSNDEKVAYTANRARQMEAIAEKEAAERAAAEAERLARLEEERKRLEQKMALEFQQRQLDRDAAVAVANIQAIIARRDFDLALQQARWACREYAGTSSAQDLAALLARAEHDARTRHKGEDHSQHENEERIRQERFCGYRDAGLAALTRRDSAAAIAAFQQALRELDDPGIRALLNELVRKSAKPGLVVADFDAGDDPGGRHLGTSVAQYVLTQMSGGQYHPVEREQFLAVLKQVGLTMADVVHDPMVLKSKKPRGIRYVVTGKIIRTAATRVSAMLHDVDGGRVIQSAESVAENRVRLRQAVDDVVAILQMSDADKAAYLRRNVYGRWIAYGRATSQAGQWAEALEAYQQACAIDPTPEAREGIKVSMERRSGRRPTHDKPGYDIAITAAKRAVQEGRWADALRAYQEANSIRQTPETLEGMRQARAKLEQADQSGRRKVEYDEAMKTGRSAAQAGKWNEAHLAYRKALDIERTREAQEAVEEAVRRIAEHKAGKGEYERAVASATEAWNKQDYVQAHRMARKALQTWGDGAEAKELLERIGPLVTVSAEVDGVEYKGAEIVVDGKPIGQRTPATLRLKKGQSYEVLVTIPSSGGDRYTVARRTIRLTENEELSTRAKLSRIRAPSAGPALPTAPVTRPRPSGTPPSPTQQGTDGTGSPLRRLREVIRNGRRSPTATRPGTTSKPVLRSGVNKRSGATGDRFTVPNLAKEPRNESATTHVYGNRSLRWRPWHDGVGGSSGYGAWSVREGRFPAEHHPDRYGRPGLWRSWY